MSLVVIPLTLRTIDVDIRHGESLEEAVERTLAADNSKSPQIVVTERLNGSFEILVDGVLANTAFTEAEAMNEGRRIKERLAAGLIRVEL